MSCYYFSETKDPAFNFATESHILKNLEEESVLYLYQCSDCVIPPCGSPSPIPRLSSGDTFVLGEGIICYAFLAREDRCNLQAQDELIRLALEYLDVSGEMEDGRFQKDGYTCSCNAVYRENGQVLHHGLLLLNASASQLQLLETYNHRKYANLTRFNHSLSKSFLCFSLKYAFECALGKSQELSLDKQAVATFLEENCASGL